MSPGMEDFFSNHVITFFIVVGLLIYLLSKGLSGGLQKGLAKLFFLVVAIIVIMFLFQKGAELARSVPLAQVPGKLLMWAVGKFGGAGGNALGSLNNAGSGMQSNYESCLYNRLQMDHLTTQLKAQCPTATP
jgi:hypothetical protein